MSRVDRQGVEEVVRAAHSWCVLLEGPDATEVDRLEFQAWLAADPQHAEFYDRAVTFYHALGEVSVEDLDRSVLRPSFRERLLKASDRIPHLFEHTGVRAAAACAAVAALAILVYHNVDFGQPDGTAAEQAIAEVHATAVGETKMFSLDDGTTVTLGAASTIEVAYSRAERRVLLVSGAAFFDVERDSQRPFAVEAADLTAIALGTRFDVKRLDGSVRVAVAEGEVEVNFPHISKTPTTGPAKRRLLTSGQQISANPEGGLQTVQSIPLTAIASWRQDTLYYDGAPLSELVADANRYSAKQVVIVGDVEAIGGLRIRGGFNARDIEGVLSALADIHPVEIDQSDPAVIRIRAEYGE